MRQSRFPVRRPFALSAAVLTLGVLHATPASAHFTLQEPESWSKQDQLGSPQKSGPCGQADPNQAAMATGVVTPYHPGDTVTITINETVMHPGHYRVSLAKDRSELPEDPEVTAGTTPCGSADIESPAMFPVLADGMLKHTDALSGPQSFEVTLPTDITCDKCTLQVIEFMSDHAKNNPGGCFYHHCADISILPGDGSGGAGGAGGMSGGGAGGAGAMSGGGTAGASAMSGGGGSAGMSIESGGTTNAGGSNIGGVTSAGMSSGGALTSGGMPASGGALMSSGGTMTSGGQTSAQSGGAATSGGSTAAGAQGQPATAGGSGSDASGCSFGAPARSTPRSLAWAPLAIGAALGLRFARRRQRLHRR